MMINNHERPTGYREPAPKPLEEPELLIRTPAPPTWWSKLKISTKFSIIALVLTPAVWAIVGWMFGAEGTLVASAAAITYGVAITLGLFIKVVADLA